MLKLMDSEHRIMIPLSKAMSVGRGRSSQRRGPAGFRPPEGQAAAAYPPELEPALPWVSGKAEDRLRLRRCRGSSGSVPSSQRKAPFLRGEEVARHRQGSSGGGNFGRHQRFAGRHRLRTLSHFPDASRGLEIAGRRVGGRIRGGFTGAARLTPEQGPAFAGARTGNHSYSYKRSSLKSIHDECGVFGIFGHEGASTLAYLGLHSLQHRGQESAGIATWDGRKMFLYRQMGLVGDIFSHALPDCRATAPSAMQILTAGSSSLLNAQPINCQMWAVIWHSAITATSSTPTH